MPQDDATMSAASRGSHAAAWAVEHGGDIVCVAIRAHDAQEWAGGGPVDVVPLCRWPTLTDKERDALAWAVWEGQMRSTTEGAEERAATLQGLLERLG
jgi:hypothetical protein